MKKTKILFAAFEAAPFIKTGGLGDVAGSLPGAVKCDEYDVRVILPLLSAIPQKYRDKMKFVEAYNVQLGWRSQYCGLFRMRLGGVTYYFLDNEYYFAREKVYGEMDDAERVAFFSKAVLETMIHIRKNYIPDIIHCNDWHTALVPVYFSEYFRSIKEFNNTKTIITIHNLKFQGQYGMEIMGDVLGLSGTSAESALEWNGCVNFMKGAIVRSDLVTTVSPTYAENICTPEYGEGLERLFLENRGKLVGIINGIDYKELDPAKDKNIKQHFDYDSIEKKAANKKALQKKLGLPVDAEKLLFAVVSRLTSQKGMDMISQILPELAKRDVQLAVLGTGDYEYESVFREFGDSHPEMAAVKISFDEPLSRKFYAGADCFLMPSRFEPCGLAQMMAMRYGTLPIVRATGGLADTVEGFEYGKKKADGFSFEWADSSLLLAEIDKAADLYYNDKKTWRSLQRNAMKKDFSWPKSAEEYKKIYDKLVKK
ncbi:MAG: glycogen synthase GlgA [Lachnospiraceae bacterium]